MGSDPDASPFNTLPPVVVALALAILGVEIALWAGGRGYLGGANAAGWRLDAVEKYGFFAVIVDRMIEIGRFPPSEVLRFVSYPFVHWGFTHALFVIVFLLALGKMVAETVSAGAVLAVFFGSAVFGALAFSALTNDNRALVGGFPAVYGLIGSFTFLLWVRLGAVGAPQYRAFSLIAVLMGIQLFFGLFFEVGLDWIAEIAGFFFGFVITPLVAPGGFQRLLERLRER